MSDTFDNLIDALFLPNINRRRRRNRPGNQNPGNQPPSNTGPGNSGAPNGRPPNKRPPNTTQSDPGNANSGPTNSQTSQSGTAQSSATARLAAETAAIEQAQAQIRTNAAYVLRHPPFNHVGPLGEAAEILTFADGDNTRAVITWRGRTMAETGGYRKRFDAITSLLRRSEFLVQDARRNGG